jgi:ketosteroid isomerase-like protein
VRGIEKNKSVPIDQLGMNRKETPMKRESTIAVLTGCCIALLALSCNQVQKPAPDTRAADAAAIRQADVAWSKVAEAKQMDDYYAYFLEDAVVLASNEPMATGKEAIQKMVGDLFAMPGFAVKWQATKVEAARSGDLGYSVGTYELSMNDPNGMPMEDRGKYVTVWKKQADGSWKVAVDTFNSDLPLQPPAE